MLDGTFRCDWLMPLKKICLRGAHYTIFPLHHLFIYLAVTRPWSVQAHARPHADTNTHTNAAFIQLIEMMPPQRSPRAQLFPPPAGSDRGQRSSIHHGRTRARARKQARWALHECSAHVLSTKNTHWGSICLLRSVKCASGRQSCAKRADIPNSAFRDEFSTACAALCVHALQPKCQTEAGEHLQHRFSLHPLGTYNVMGTKIYYLSLHLNLSFALSTHNQSRIGKTSLPRRSCFIPKCKSSRQHV